MYVFQILCSHLFCGKSCFIYVIYIHLRTLCIDVSKAKSISDKSVSFNGNTTGFTSGAGTVYPSGTHPGY